jgi:SSS family solute:Na+ symporter
MDDVNGVELVIVIVFFVLVTAMGFAAARWRRGQSLLHLDEWGLGGRGFGTFTTWFLLGGDLYTAYTFIAVPAAVFAGGAMGYWALPYAAIAYPIVFLVGPRLWSVSHVRGYVTTADFVRGRFGSKSLGLAVAVTGIMAMMPYIALQLVGIQAVLTVHVPVRAARAGADRVRQGRPDLHRDHRGGHLHPDEAGRLGSHLRQRPDQSGQAQPRHGQAERFAHHQ